MISAINAAFQLNGTDRFPQEYYHSDMFRRNTDGGSCEWYGVKAERTTSVFFFGAVVAFHQPLCDWGVGYIAKKENEFVCAPPHKEIAHWDINQ
jgi:hypothetical protein